MNKPLNILLVDDNPDDRMLVIRELKKEFPAVQVDQIVERVGFDQAVQSGHYDLVITDYHLRWTDGLKVLRAVKECAPDCPVIMFTGTGSEQVAVEAMKAGLNDYVLKSPEHFGRLRLAAKMAIEQSHQRRALHVAEGRYRQLFGNVPVGLCRITCEGTILEANPALVRITGCPDLETLLAYNAADFLIGHESRDPWRVLIEAGQDIHSFESLCHKLDGTPTWIHLSAVVVRDPQQQLQYYEVVVEDITQQKKAQESLLKEKAFSDSVINSMPGIFYLFDDTGNSLRWNRNLEIITEYSFEEIQRMHPLDFVVEKDFIQRQIEKTFTSGHSETEGTIVTKSGIKIPYYFTGMKITIGELPCVIGVGIDITERIHAEERLHYLAHHDTLTNLPNRTLFNDRLEQAMIDAKRHERLVGVVFLDLDRFKNINDSLGHEKGDLLIKAVADRLVGTVRKGDTVARLGGDEFTFVLADMGHVDDAARVAHKILDVFSHPFNIDGRELYMTASLGVTLYPFDDIDIQALLRNADVAMYRAKDAGRNSYQFYTAEMTAKAAEFLALENDLRHALERDEFYLEYQPVVDCRVGGIISLEALVRWRHPVRGTISPMQFIPLAEETGQIVPIGEWVLRTACAQCRAWQDSGFTALRIAVNLSVRQFHQLKFADAVEKILHETGLGAASLDLEITESIIMQHADITVATLNSLNSMGVRISIDDFGTGYSSLSYLKRFPIDALKIDQSFVRDITTDPDDSAIAQAIINLAHTLGIQVVAEGVETVEQLEFLQQHSCDSMQGFYFSRPVAPEEIERMLRAGKRLEFNK
ncbi:MAG: putative bifunctional diguanylate cyclase/phosphodiesterase [Sulfuricaulis sp.]